MLYDASTVLPGMQLDIAEYRSVFLEHTQRLGISEMIRYQEKYLEIQQREVDQQSETKVYSLI